MKISLRKPITGYIEHIKSGGQNGTVLCRTLSGHQVLTSRVHRSRRIGRSIYLFPAKTCFGVRDETYHALAVPVVSEEASGGNVRPIVTNVSHPMTTVHCRIYPMIPCRPSCTDEPNTAQTATHALRGPRESHRNCGDIFEGCTGKLRVGPLGGVELPVTEGEASI